MADPRIRLGHGTRARWQRGCRCDLCCEASSIYAARHRRSEARVSDVLAAFCWCQQEIVHVPTHEVRSGLTRSCGAPRCAA